MHSCSSSARSPSHRPRQLRLHDHGGGANPIYVDHLFTDIGCGSNHDGYDSDHSINISDHADNALPVFLLQRVADRQRRPAWGYRPSCLASTCSDYLSCRNNDHCEEWRYDNCNHRHDITSGSSRATQFCCHRPDFCPKISWRVEMAG